MNILVTVDGQRVKVNQDQINFVEGSKRHVKFIFHLSKEWQNLALIAIFAQDGVAHSRPIENNCAFIPVEIKSGVCDLSLFGTAGSIMATTDHVRLFIQEDISNIKETNNIGGV